jgi:hypothetical protein
LDRKNCTSGKCWQSPREGRLKFNIDASFILDSGETTVGFIGRDHHDLIKIAASLAIDVCRDAEEAEACAIREGINLCLEHDMVPDYIESYSSNAVASSKSCAFASRSWESTRKLRT